MSDWAVTNLLNANVVKKGNTIEVKIESNDVIKSDESIYWIAPSAYRGNKVGSFAYCRVKICYRISAFLLTWLHVHAPDVYVDCCVTKKFQTSLISNRYNELRVLVVTIRCVDG
jgi:hypothetical protein